MRAAVSLDLSGDHHAANARDRVREFSREIAVIRSRAAFLHGNRLGPVTGYQKRIFSLFRTGLISRDARAFSLCVANNYTPYDRCR